MKLVVCGGSGFSLRRQRAEGAILQEEVEGKLHNVAVSHQFIGKTGREATPLTPTHFYRWMLPPEEN